MVLSVGSIFTVIIKILVSKVPKILIERCVLQDMLRFMNDDCCGTGEVVVNRENVIFIEGNHSSRTELCVDVRVKGYANSATGKEKWEHSIAIHYYSRGNTWAKRRMDKEQLCVSHWKSSSVDTMEGFGSGGKCRIDGGCKSCTGDIFERLPNSLGNSGQETP